MDKQQFFEGLRVVELASVLAGPAIGLFFAELGAEVVKVENARTEGDVTRRWKLPSEPAEADYSAYYCSVNYKKNVRMIDLSAPQGRAEVLELIADADIVVSNFKRASAQKLGMDYDTLYEHNPALIYAQLDAFGADDPLPAFDVVLQAEAGFLYMNGEPGRDPVKMPVALIDILAAHQLKEAVLLALLHRYRTGKGSFVSTSLLDAAIASLANQATNWLMEGHIPQPMGMQHPNIAPYGDIFYGSDGKPLVLAAGTEGQFTQLCQCLGLPELTQDERFASNKSRVQHRSQLCDQLRPAFERADRAAWMKKLGEAGVPVGSIRNMREVFEREQAKNLILEEPMPDGRNSRRVATAAFKWKPAG
ncbi:CaiB/BaiF CoA transferase family protein [Phaeodactylibacter xiamenensis]|uniref:Carnitine dehydratase n=1 Tax=Phaeodactylibacter xiamenensis TaxID=1524460 RepID=A0A098S5R7_9BACT|nr:CaiB/BaiF CoA-transferase family protein [Phaeodactylibacter xiamenensis]KGE86572.1 carnitine dehydratase [Phaeodactylibacter xiamenensis]MCR9052859.1 CoA transferase [bacterium]